MSNFKYEAIADWAKKQIAEKGMGQGEQFYSENELCDIHNVSRQTVRQALALLEQQGVLTKRRGAGTFVSLADPAPGLQGRKVGVISTLFSDYIFPSIVTGLDLVLKQNEVTMQLSITQNRVAEETRALKAMLDQNVSGLIVDPSKSALPNPNRDLYEEAERRGIPVVFFNAKYSWAHFPCAAMDDVRAARIVTDYLFSLGHTNITAILSLDDMQGRLRYQGFMESFKAHGADNAEESVLWYASGELQSLFSSQRERVNSLLSRSTAVVCYNDNVAIKFLGYCRELEIKVPEELSVVGIDDSKLARICEVPLTTARHPHQELGECAANMLLDMMKNPGKKVPDHIFEPKLIVRSSAVPPQETRSD